MGNAWELRELEDAHGHSIRNRPEVERSTFCGCFNCKVTFVPAEIEEWIEDRVEEGPVGCRELKPVTATCPNCAHDCVLGDASGYPVTDPTFLGAMHRHFM